MTSSPTPVCHVLFFFFFFNDTATTEIYTLSLHDALPIFRTERHPPAGARCGRRAPAAGSRVSPGWYARGQDSAWRTPARRGDRKSTRLNSSHGYISYAVFCLKKKNTLTPDSTHPR